MNKRVSDRPDAPPTSPRQPRKLQKAHARPHRLVLYEHAVQQPWLMVNWLVNMYAANFPGDWPEHLREDFAGAAAIAMAWVGHDPRHHALAIERDQATFNHARRRAAGLARAGLLDEARLQIVLGDVMTPRSGRRPKQRPQIVIATNFSINYFHQRDDLLAYFKAVRKALAPDGLLVMDTYQGPGAWRCSSQHRPVHPPTESGIAPFTYTWRQASVNHVTARVKCAIDFTLADKRTIRNAFVYDWRLWSIPELTDALAQAGFANIETWHDPENEGQLQPVASIDDEEDIVAYLVARKQGAKMTRADHANG